MEMEAEEQERKQERKNPICCGCGKVKESKGLVICWNCYKYRQDIAPLKYFAGSFKQWLKLSDCSNAILGKRF